MEQQITCINCPVGCRLQVVLENGQVVSVSGNSCKRGEIYGTQEFTAPKRVVTSLVRLTSGGVVSVKTDGLVLKTLIPEVLSEIGKLRLSAPLKIGDVAKENVAGSGVNLVVTEDIK